MPEGAVYVGRPSKWGNPFKPDDAIEAGFAQGKADAPKVCVDAFEDWLKHRAFDWPFGDELREAMLDGLGTLRGKDLACWCPLGQPCHADVLLKLANTEEQP